MNRRETVDVVFLAAVVIVLVAAFIYVNLPGDEEEGEEEATDEGGEVVEGGDEGESGSEAAIDIVESQAVPQAVSVTECS